MTKQEAQDKLQELYVEHEGLEDKIKEVKNLKIKQDLVIELIKVAQELKTFELALENWEIISDWIKEYKERK